MNRIQLIIHLTDFDIALAGLGCSSGIINQQAKGKGEGIWLSYPIDLHIRFQVIWLIFVVLI